MARLAQHMQGTNGVIKTTGAHAVIKTLKAFGVDVIFANPGTTEMPLISALGDVNGRFCAWRARRSAAPPAAMLGCWGSPRTILHLGGAANALANLHNATAYGPY